MHFLCTVFVIPFNHFPSEKKFLSSRNKVFRVDVNFIKEILFSWETIQLKRWKLFGWNIEMMIGGGL